MSVQYIPLSYASLTYDVGDVRKIETAEMVEQSEEDGVISKLEVVAKGFPCP